jgi:hypothetical protein
MNRETILKHHDRCSTFVFSIDSISREEMFLLQKANGLVLSEMNVKNINCFILKDNTLKFIIGGDCSTHEDTLQQNISFGLNYMGIPNDYLGLIIDVS